jgi:hypothetical protein
MRRILIPFEKDRRCLQRGSDAGMRIQKTRRGIVPANGRHCIWPAAALSALLSLSVYPGCGGSSSGSDGAVDASSAESCPEVGKDDYCAYGTPGGECVDVMTNPICKNGKLVCPEPSFPVSLCASVGGWVNLDGREPYRPDASVDVPLEFPDGGGPDGAERPDASVDVPLGPPDGGGPDGSDTPADASDMEVATD